MFSSNKLAIAPLALVVIGVFFYLPSILDAEEHAGGDKRITEDALKGLLDGVDIDQLGGDGAIGKLLEGLQSGGNSGAGNSRGSNSRTPFKGKNKADEYKETVKALLEKADALMAERKYEEAALFYKVVASSRVKGMDEEKKRALEALAEMEKLAADKFQAASDLLVRRRPKEAVFVYRFISEELPNTKFAGKARAKQAELMKQPRVAGYVAFLDAEALEAAGDLLGAAEAYRKLIKNYPDTVEALKARKRIKALNKDPDTAARYNELLAAQAEKEAPKLLQLAKQYAERAEKTDNDKEYKKLKVQAVKRANEVAERFPGTTYAKEARAIIDSLH